MRLDPALVKVASAAGDDAAAIAVLADACQKRRTTPERLLAAGKAHPNLPRRRFLREVLDDVASGAYSALGHRHLSRVERPHGLPTAARQRAVRAGRTSAHRDVEYLGLAAVVELDGRLGHELTADRWATSTATSTACWPVTRRCGWAGATSWSPAAPRPAVVSRFLGACGWDGDPTACIPDCTVDGTAGGRRLWLPRSGGYSSAGA